MKGYVNIPKTIYVKRCKECGTRPIIALAAEGGGYVVKCPADNNHYHTQAGMIDLEDWNMHNNAPSGNDYNVSSVPSLQP